MESPQFETGGAEPNRIGPLSLPLRDGSRILAREIRPDDAAALQRLFGRLSRRSVYLRFFGLLPELSDEQARRFAEIDGHDRLAVVALDHGQSDEIIAVVRLDRDAGTATGEYAAAVEDGWQGRGVGRALTELLVDRARRSGFTSIYAYVLPENARMLALLRDLTLPQRLRWVDGMSRVDVEIVPPEPSGRD